MNSSIIMLVCIGAVFAIVIFILTEISGGTNAINHAKKRVVGDGQEGNSRWANEKEIRKSYTRVLYDPESWRRGEALPEKSGVIIHSEVAFNKRYAYVETEDVHTLMTASSGAGKTAHFLYPNIEYACACGVSFITTDTKGDLYRNYAGIAEKYYGYKNIVIDLRNPTSSACTNMLHLVNKYMDLYLQDENDLNSKAKAEKHAKILANTIINNGDDGGGHGQNAYFYESAEGLLASIILVVSEFALPDERHIVTVFKMIQELMQPSNKKGKTQYQVLLESLPTDHMARMLAGATLYTAEQAMASVTSTAMSKLNAFLDSELQQMLCFENDLNVDLFDKNKLAVFLIMPEEDSTKYFLITLLVQQIYEELLGLADGQNGKLKRRVIFFLDEIGTIPKIKSMNSMLSASRSRNIVFVPIIQSRAQFEDKYGKEGADSIITNCRNTITGGFPPQSDSTEHMSNILGYQTVSGMSVTKTKDGVSTSEQMVKSRLINPNELVELPRGDFVVLKSGGKPFIAHLDLFLNWGITFEGVYELADKGIRTVKYANKSQIEEAMVRKYQAVETVEVVKEKGSGVITMEIDPFVKTRKRKKIERVVERI